MNRLRHGAPITGGHVEAVARRRGGQGGRPRVYGTRLPDARLIEEHPAAARVRWKELARV